MLELFKSLGFRWSGVLFGCFFAVLAAGGAPGRIVVALKPDKDPDHMVAEKGVLERFLSEATGREVHVIIPLSSAVILGSLANGSVDAAYVSATEMIMARDRGIADLLLAGEIDGNTWYRSYWVTLEGKPYRSVEDLRGRRVAFSSRTSTSGFVVPLKDLYDRGLVGESGNPEEFFGRGNVFYGVGYVSAIERVLAGHAEAAAVSYYVLDLDRHLSPEQRAMLRKLQEQGPVPTHVIAVRSTISSEEAGRLRKAFLMLNDPARTNLRDRLFTGPLVEVDADEHLEGLARALALASRALLR